jgi:eukaryotic-like serine/threonine-protein kinase
VALSAGTHLGPYQILVPIGAGGMGEVYKASDSRLNRTVAIKVLPPQSSKNPEMKQRFEREAQAIAGLNHPHICTLHDVGHQDGIDYLVMEYLEGETLAHRLERGALRLDEALKAAVEIADALDKAHRQGVVHRDLKPSNVMLAKSGTKLLDFGLAKLTEPQRPAAVSTLATRTDLTAQGTILGTLQYMAPEQLEGGEADSRTDIFAFGVVLYEMVTGRKAFDGKSQASLISAIMSSDPQPPSSLQPMTPPLLDHVVKTCLAKDPELRWQTARDLLTQLKWIAQGATQLGLPVPVAARRRKRERVLWTLLGLAMVAVIVLAVPAFLYVRGPEQPDEVRFLASVPAMPNAIAIAVSPDGRWIAYAAATAAGRTSLFVRPIGSIAPQLLVGTEGGPIAPFWSPDSRSIGFFVGGRLKKVDVSGGPPQTICDAGSTWGGTWNSDGIIVFSSNNLLYRVSASGGVPTPITSLDQSQGETGHYAPYFLPDGRHYLYLVWSADASNSALYVGLLDSMERVRLMAAESMAAYAEPGYILFQRQGTLFAQMFDPKRLQVTGEQVRIADAVITNPGVGRRSAFAVSRNNTLIYRSDNGTTENDSQFVWFDRSGKQIANAGKPGPYAASFDLSPDAKRIVATRRDSGNLGDVWVIEWARDIATRLTFDPVADNDPIWSPDGLRVAFDSNRKGSNDIFVKNVSGTAEEESVLSSVENEYAEDWSRDGRYIAYVYKANGESLNALPLFGDRKPFTVVKSPFPKDEPHFSFDGKWLAYASNESGTWQVYVVSFPTADQKYQISTDGGSQPRWRSDGKELYYLSLDGKLMAAGITAGEKIQSGIPRMLFETGLTTDPIRDQYAVTPDGQRFLLLRPLTGATPTPITVVINWTASLKK